MIEQSTRPTAFADVIGHGRARAFLRGAGARGYISHAYLFAGPPRIGKTTLALAFAHLLLCESPQDGYSRACGACQSCRLASSGSHPDLLVLERETSERGREAKNISVRQVDRLLHDVGLTAHL